MLSLCSGMRCVLRFRMLNSDLSLLFLLLFCLLYWVVHWMALLCPTVSAFVFFCFCALQPSLISSFNQKQDQILSLLCELPVCVLCHFHLLLFSRVLWPFCWKFFILTKVHEQYNVIIHGKCIVRKRLARHMAASGYP